MQKTTPAPLKRSVVVALVLLAALFASFSVSAQSLNRWYNAKWGKHYYTTATTGGYYYPVYEGSIGILSPSPAGPALYAVTNPSTGDRVLTISEAEKNYLTTIGFVNEGILGYTFPYGQPGTGASLYHTIYRYFHAQKKEHFYTNNLNELGYGRWGYQYEGVAFYLYGTCLPNC
jgi:hypothetical protein